MFNFIVQKLHREGYRFVAIAAVITFILLLINNYLGPFNPNGLSTSSLELFAEMEGLK